MGKHRSLRGADLHAPSSELVENHSGATIPVLKAVTFDGMGTVYPQIRLASSAVDTIRGITQAEILNDAAGYVTALGFLNGVNTSAWTVNTRLYANTTGDISSTSSGLPVGVVLKQDTVNGIIYVDNTGITKSDLDALEFPDSLSLELQWSVSFPNYYSEPAYDINNKITRVDIWNNPSKSIHIFSKVFTYTGAQITDVLITRETDGQTLQKIITYTGAFVTNVTRVYTP